MTVRTEWLWLSSKNTKEMWFKYCTYIPCSLSIVLCTVRQKSSALLMKTKSVLSLLSFCSNDMYLYADTPCITWLISKMLALPSRCILVTYLVSQHIKLSKITFINNSCTRMYIIFYVHILKFFTIDL